MENVLRTCAAGCDRPAFAKGMCRVCYMANYRHVKSEEASRAAVQAAAVEKVRAIRERVESFDRPLCEARQMYEMVCGLPARLKWKRRILELEGLQRAAAEGVDTDRIVSAHEAAEAAREEEAAELHS